LGFDKNHIGDTMAPLVPWLPRPAHKAFRRFASPVAKGHVAVRDWYRLFAQPILKNTVIFRKEYCGA
jgi:hypothetical protein